MEILRTIIALLAAICSANAFSKYGRSCKDIGCLPSESCVMAEDSCSYHQEKNRECGQYPTCKKVASVNQSPGPSDHHDTPDNTVTRKPFSPPPAPSAPAFNPSIPTGSGGYYPNSGNNGIPSGIYPSLPNNGNNDPYPNRNVNPQPNPNPYNPNPYSPDPNRGSYDPYRGGSNDPYGNRGANDPYNGNRYNNRDDDRDKGSSGSGSTISSLLNFLRGGGGSSTRYGSPSSSGGLSYGDIFNALSNRGGGSNSGGGSGLSDILSAFGNRGSSGGGFGGPSSNNGGGGLTDIFFGRNGNKDPSIGGSSNNNYDRNYDDRRQQPTPSSSNGGGFLSSLSSLFGQQVANSLIQNALSGNRGGSGDNSGGGSGLINSLRYSGLFNENNGHGTNNVDKPKVTVSGAGPGGYPTQAPYRPPNNQNMQNYATYNNAQQYAAPSAAQSSPTSQSNSTPTYGWKV